MPRWSSHHLFLAAFALVFAACPGPTTPPPECTGDECTAKPALTNVRLTHLGVAYDVTKPLFLNNRVPISFGVTADTEYGTEPLTKNVAVGFSFVEAEPADPANPAACASSAIDVEVVGDGREKLVDAFIWPTSDCADLRGKRVNLEVSFDGSYELDDVPDAVGAPSVLFSAAKAGEALNQQCRSARETDSATPGLGCVYALDLEATPVDANGSLIDVRYELTASSSVALVPFRRVDDLGPGGPPSLEPSLVVETNFVVNGRDPYVSPMTPGETVPADLVAAEPTIVEDLKFGLDDAQLAALRRLPGQATVHYTLHATRDQTTRMPLTIKDPEGTTRVERVAVAEVAPGTSRTLSHELFIEGQTLASVSDGGVWAADTDFVVTGCFEAQFPQAGNEGEGDAALSDCRTLPVRLVRETAPNSAATSLSFNKEFGRELGSSRIGIEAGMSTTNKLDRTGASSENEGSVVLKGNLGKSFDLTIARAFATAKLSVNPEENGYELGVEAFNNTVYSITSVEPRIVRVEDFSTAKSFELGGLGFGFGPVRVGFKVSVGGEVGLSVEDTLEILGNNATCTDLLATGDTITMCGRMARVVTPRFALTGRLFGGIDVRLVKAGVQADLSFVNTTFPLSATLGFGTSDTNQFVVRGDARWDMNLTLIEGDVAIVGSVGIRRWRKKLRVPLFSFSSPELSFNLMNTSLLAPVVLD